MGVGGAGSILSAHLAPTAWAGRSLSAKPLRITLFIFTGYYELARACQNVRSCMIQPEGSTRERAKVSTR